MSVERIKNYVQWAEGVVVTEEDAKALDTDRRLYGSCYVEKIGSGFGRRINPAALMMGFRRPVGASSQTQSEEGKQP